MTDRELMQMALEALEKVTTEMLALKDALAERGARPTTNVFHQRLWDSSFKAYTDHALPAAAAIREALRARLAETEETVMFGLPTCPRCGETNPAEIHTCTPKPEPEPVAWLYTNKLGGRQVSLIEPPPNLKEQYQPLYTIQPQTNYFNPDWDAIPVMVEEQQRMTKRIEESEAQLGEAMWGYGEWRRKAEILSALCTRQGIRLMEYELQETQKPVAWFVYIPSQQCGEYFDSEDDNGLVDWMTNYPDAELTKLYTAPPHREWQGLTDEEIIKLQHLIDWTAHWSTQKFAHAIEAKLKEKNG